jgi:hypothetical protein
MAKQFQRRRFFRNQPINNKNCMLWPCLLTDRNEMSNLHRGHSIDDSYQVSVVAKKKCLLTDRDEMSNLNRGHSIDDSYQVSVVAMFVNDWDEMCNLHRGHSIDASYKVSVHLAKRFRGEGF